MKSRLRVASTALRPDAFLPAPRCFLGAEVSATRPFQAANQRQACRHIAAKGGSGAPFRNNVAGKRRPYSPARIKYQRIHAHGLL